MLFLGKSHQMLASLGLLTQQNGAPKRIPVLRLYTLTCARRNKTYKFAVQATKVAFMIKSHINYTNIVTIHDTEHIFMLSHLQQCITLATTHRSSSNALWTAPSTSLNQLLKSTTLLKAPESSSMSTMPCTETIATLMLLSRTTTSFGRPHTIPNCPASHTSCSCSKAKR